MKGEVYINGHDAYERWGVSFEDGAISALIAPPSMKEYIESESRKEHGKRMMADNARIASRELTLPFHLLAKDRVEFFARYDAFCDEVLKDGSFTMCPTFLHKTGYLSDGNIRFVQSKAYKLFYLSCSQFRQFDQRMGVFSLRVSEPNPSEGRGYHFHYKLTFPSSGVLKTSGKLLYIDTFAPNDEATREWVSSEPTWCHIEYDAVKDAVLVWCDANETQEPRTATVTVSRGAIQVITDIYQL